MTYSFPCFTKDMLVLTKEDGYVRFENVIPHYHHVMAKDHKWHIVTKFFEQGKKETFYVSGQGFESIHCTPEHKFWVREKVDGHFTEPHWKHANELNKSCWFGVPVIDEEIPFATDNEDFWYIMGAYIGDGWINKSCNDMKIACSQKKLDNLKDKFKNIGLVYTINQNSEHCWNLRTHNKEIVKFALKTFGTGSMEKKIPFEVLALPKKQLMAFFEGYISADGCIYNKLTQFSTINPNIAYSFSLIANKLFHRICNIYKIKVSPKKVIEGRTVNQRDYYQIKLRNEKSYRDCDFYQDGYIWYKFRKSWIGEVEEVYDIEVEEDHSFTLNGCLVSNCQDLSTAGQHKGMEEGSGTRSSMLWEVGRILKEMKRLGQLPDMLLMENVPTILGEKNIGGFNKWVDLLYSLGYDSYTKILSATGFGIPQSRRRCFVVSVPHGYTYEFPEEEPLKVTLRDMLEDEVDEKYFLSQDEITQITQWKSNQNPITKGLAMGGVMCQTVTAKSNTAHNYNMLLTSVDRRLKETIESNVLPEGVPQGIDLYNKSVRNTFPTLKMPNHNTYALWNGRRVRKLTPRECFRLMGVKDADSDKITLSDHFKYHLAGDSIVVNVLEAIFKKALP